MKIVVDRSPVLSGQNRKKTRMIFIFLLAWFLVIGFRLIDLQVLNHKKLKQEVIEQNQDLITIWPTRGTIFDRQGRILARSLPAVSIFFSPTRGEDLKDQLKSIYELKSILNLSETEINRLVNSIEKRKRFTWVKRKIPLEQAEKIKGLKLSGIYLINENKRFYPQGRLAAHVLGGVNIDDAGLAGVEYYYDSALRGREGQQLIMRDARRKEYYIETIKETQPGQDIYLTIDSNLQYLAEKELRQAIEKFKASWGTVIIMSPASGEILAMASYPDYDPNDFPPPPEAMVNRAIQYTYEPGSTAKVVTAAAARELAGISYNTYYDCRTGSITFGGTSVRDHVRLGILSFPDVFIHSSNVGSIQIAEIIGEKNLYHMFKAFQFGEKTGIDLPGEEAGIVHPLEKWRKSSLRVAIGYELAATPLQILRAMNVYATGGYLVRPKVGLIGPYTQQNISDGSLRSDESRQPVISEKTARELVDLVFKPAVERGTGNQARLDGYELAGKTGTAQKFDPALRAYSISRHVASFVGFAPADHPLISMIVVIDEPKGPQYGGQVAAPVFREIARKALLYYHEPPQKLPENMILARQTKESGVTD
ncbi:MAG TPA: penicillin-binding protein 2 [Candidatus Saccharicenans sp.]|nr:penicillin-binding protein 2 [Candidatus Saccharicenans sp.]HQE64351.1 penicillin-binding protein 2 [Candidatus Saccharicenans sp.]HQH60374.1 penicillin-binding protein 2 [Candidatus Saccharicenans sp.]